MTANRDLHTRRLQEARAMIPTLRTGSDTALSEPFRAWHQKVMHSLQELFGKDHHYSKAFRALPFWLTRVSIGGGDISWSRQDQARFTADLATSDALLGDALEELPSVTTPAPRTPSTPAAQPPIVVNVLNVLSQSTSIELTQLLADIDSLALPAEAKALAATSAKELAAEVRGQQRWPLMAKSLEALRGLGKGAYEKVALPLLLELIKKQTGLS